MSARTGEASPLPDAVDAAAALRAGTLSAGALLARCRARRDEDLGAYRTWAPEFAARQAAAADAAFAAGIDAGPLQGLPVSVKDLFGVAGLPLYAGSARALPADWQREGPLVRRLRAQLGVIVGKTHTVEFAFGGLGTNVHWGAPRNPHDRARLPGGSSSGAGVSVAEGSALLALGTDTAGSVRIPASMTGTAGLKTTQGRWSIDGIVPLSPSLDTPGLIARSARDLAYAFAALDGGSPPGAAAAPPAALRLGVPERFFWSDCDPGVVEAVEHARARLEAAGARCVPLELPGCDEAFALLRAGGLAAPELDRFLADELPQWRAGLDPAVRARMEAAERLSAREYLRRLARHRSLSRAAVAAVVEVDAVLTPTVPITPPRSDAVAAPEAYRAANMLALRNTAVVNLLGLCALTLPAGTDAAGMPVGLQLIAAPRHEERLLALARSVEQVVDRPAAIA